MNVQFLKLKLSFIISICLVPILDAENFYNYQQRVNKDFINYKNMTNKNFFAYKDAQEKAMKEFVKELRVSWKDPQLSTKYQWVEYSNDLQRRKSIDYKKHIIHFEVYSTDKKEALKKFSLMLDETLQEDVSTAHKKDLLEHKIATILHTKASPVHSSAKLIGNNIDKKDLKQIEKSLNINNINTYIYKEKEIYTIDILLPNRVMTKNAMRFQKEIFFNAKREKLPASLIYAIIHSESAFNPMARSYIPAFGLMQIVPKSAGIDAYYYLYGYKKLLSAEYLYKPDKNIRIGSAYLHLLFYNYFKHIINNESRLYCTIAAYNTGAGNVARAFGSRGNISSAIQKINRLSSREVYNILLSNLPYDETKHYLKIVNQRRYMYQKFFSKKG